MRKFVFLLLLCIFAFSINAFAQSKTVADTTDEDLPEIENGRNFKVKMLKGFVVTLESEHKNFFEIYEFVKDSLNITCA